MLPDSVRCLPDYIRFHNFTGVLFGHDLPLLERQWRMRGAVIFAMQELRRDFWREANVC